jgi:hypothetical protein
VPSLVVTFQESRFWGCEHHTGCVELSHQQGELPQAQDSVGEHHVGYPPRPRLHRNHPRSHHRSRGPRHRRGQPLLRHLGSYQRLEHPSLHRPSRPPQRFHAHLSGTTPRSYHSPRGGLISPLYPPPPLIPNGRPVKNSSQKRRKNLVSGVALSHPSV